MTDDELIAHYQAKLDVNIAEYPVEVYDTALTRLIELARIGAAVKPRLISDVPKDDTVLLYVCAGPENSTYREGTNDGWREHYIDEKGTICNTFSWIKDTTINDTHWKATAWISLSALPKPE